jgi:hypothetical protein
VKVINFMTFRVSYKAKELSCKKHERMLELLDAEVRYGRVLDINVYRETGEVVEITGKDRFEKDMVEVYQVYYGGFNGEIMSEETYNTIRMSMTHEQYVAHCYRSVFVPKNTELFTLDKYKGAL